VRMPILQGLLFAAPLMAHQLSPLIIRRVGRRRLPYLLGAATAILVLLDIVVYAPSRVFIYFSF
jgi:hypothetical protein